MTKPRRIAFIGNSLPRRCGIATFTTDLEQAISRSGTATATVAMTDHGHVYDYPASVAQQIRDDRPEDYRAAAAFLNAGGFDVVSLQHEFGIFGGEAGGHIMTLLNRLTMPVVTTLHTVLADPTPVQRHALGQVIAASQRVVVMAEKGRALLKSVYGVAAEKVEMIPHGIPDAPFAEPDQAKARMGFAGKAVILTFGLLSPNKGIEVMIDAMPGILRARPDAVYVVLGATHPNLARTHGEAYRDSLVSRARALGVADHVVFEDRFVDKATLLDFIAMCDVYVTPYLNEAQMTSGTLAYSFGLGKAVVSTPYWHARELLADGRGVLVPFGDSVAIGDSIGLLLTDDARRQAMRERAYAASRSMTWERTAERYLTCFDRARRSHRLSALERAAPVIAKTPPPIELGHFLSMCDDTGLYQHAVHSVPDRLHGYCVDDNARALLLAATLAAAGEERLTDQVTQHFAAFVQHAWNPDTRRFRNFMSFSRAWLEDRGSEDSHGRTLWALGECARVDASPSRRRWAAGLFAQALPTVEGFDSHRSWAFTLLGLVPYLTVNPSDSSARRIQGQLADRLMAALAEKQTADWLWFEDVLAYDNARLPQALLVTGMATGRNALVEAGLKTLGWLMRHQTAPEGHFRAVGSASFGGFRRPPELFDQQPLEAAATISAAVAALAATDDPVWREVAMNAFEWFLGRNDLSVPLADIATGSCRDGLHPDRPNENRGGESIVSYLLGLAEIRQLARVSKPCPPREAVPVWRDTAVPLSAIHRSSRRFVSSHVSEPAGPLSSS